MFNFTAMTPEEAENLNFKINVCLIIGVLIICFQIGITIWIYRKLFTKTDTTSEQAVVPSTTTALVTRSVATSTSPLTFYGEKDTQCPNRAKARQAGLDIFFHYTVCIKKDTIKEVDLKVGIQIPEGYFGWVTLRSSAHKRRILVHGGAVIDEYFAGHIRVYLWNASTTEDYVLVRGESILQLLILPCHQGLARLVHPNQLRWAQHHLTLRTGSSGNTGGKAICNEGEEELRARPAIQPKSD